MIIEGHMLFWERSSHISRSLRYWICYKLRLVCWINSLLTPRVDSWLLVSSHSICKYCVAHDVKCHLWWVNRDLIDMQTYATSTLQGANSLTESSFWMKLKLIIEKYYYMGPAKKIAKMINGMQVTIIPMLSWFVSELSDTGGLLRSKYQTIVATSYMQETHMSYPAKRVSDSFLGNAAEMLCSYLA